MAGPKPEYSSAALDVASDANYSVQSDARDGTPTKVVPSAGIITQGARPARQFGAQHRNWLDSEFAAIKTAIIEHVLEIEDVQRASPALTFREATNVAAPIWKVKFNPYAGEWYAIGPGASGATDTPSFLRSRNPFSWIVGATEIGAGALDPMVPADVAFNDAGIIIVPDQNIDYMLRYNGSTWAVISAALGDDPSAGPHVVWDPVSGLFCYAFFHTVSPYARVFTSADDGATWTSRTGPAVGATTIGVSMETDGAGTIWMQAFDSAGGVNFSSSTDGGVTWSALSPVSTPFVVLDPAISGALLPKPIFDGSYWYAVVPDEPDRCAVLRKAPAGSWALVNIYDGAMCLESIAALPGGLIVGVTSDSRVVMSRDYAETFQATDFDASRYAVGSRAPRAFDAYANGHRFVIAGEDAASNETSVWVSSGVGTGGAVIAP